jgi:hypothetical protein
MEIKLAYLHDAESARLGDLRYGLRRAARSWADDIYRLLVGPKRPSCCCFLLSVFTPECDVDLGEMVAKKAKIPTRRKVNADDAWEFVSKLAAEKVSAGAIARLAEWSRDELGASVYALGKAKRDDDHGWWYWPLLFEWVQQSPASSKYAVDL